jgi:hypothetical protein
MKELSAFKRINLLKCCDIGSRMTHFGFPRVKTQSRDMFRASLAHPQEALHELNLVGVACFYGCRLHGFWLD